MSDEIKALRDELREAQVLIELLYLHLFDRMSGKERDAVFASLENKALQLQQEGSEPKMLMSAMRRLKGVDG